MSTARRSTAHLSDSSASHLRTSRLLWGTSGCSQKLSIELECFCSENETLQAYGHPCSAYQDMNWLCLQAWSSLLRLLSPGSNAL